MFSQEEISTILSAKEGELKTLVALVANASRRKTLTEEEKGDWAYILHFVDCIRMQAADVWEGIDSEISRRAKRDKDCMEMWQVLNRISYEIGWWDSYTNNWGDNEGVSQESGGDDGHKGQDEQAHQDKG